MFSRLICVLVLASLAWCAPESYCAPSPDIELEFQKAAAKVGNDPADFARNVAPFRAVREKYPRNLFAHERYQDAVRKHGIEGHLRALAAEYQALEAKNSNDWEFNYLLNRALLGRNTKAVTLAMETLAQQHPDFPLAHRLLAEIYSTEAFHDAEKKEAELRRLQELCPAATLGEDLDALPASSPLINEADRLLAIGGDPEQAAKLAEQGIRADEWRLQRIRPFDWYSVAFKREQQDDLRKNYWRAWGIQVRGYWKTQQRKKGDGLLRSMEERAAFLNVESDSVRWQALFTLASLYEEGKQPARAAEKLDAMREMLVKHPDSVRLGQVEEIQQKLKQPEN